MVAYRNTRTGRVVHLAEALPSMDRSKRWERVDPGQATEPAEGREDGLTPPWPAPTPDPGGEFDPREHTVAQVNEYLAGADLGERHRVLRIEAEDRGRRGILAGPWAGSPEE